MNGNQALRTIIESAPSRDDAVEGAYLAMRLLSDRAVLGRGVSRKAFLAWDPISSPESRRLALAIVKEITKRESAPLHKISHERLDMYAKSLSEAMLNRLKQDLPLNEGRGHALLEELRRAG